MRSGRGGPYLQLHHPAAGWGTVGTEVAAAVILTLAALGLAAWGLRVLAARRLVREAETHLREQAVREGR